ncbi:MAG: ribosome-associated translation inhibitor RaiA [Candidatus Pacebacteria bacterium]|nr:ribosome-associated translation inhibitor RaiA [Candidatus Paceibacterota bacterium]
MQSTIKTTNYEMTPDVSAYIDEKFVTFEKYISKDDESVKCDIEVGRTTNHHQTGDIYRVEVNLSIGKTMFRAESTSKSLHGAVDEVKDEINKQLRRSKKKRTDLFRKGGDQIKKMLRFGRGE